jgi:predicted nucleic acid-binding protein
VSGFLLDTNVISLLAPARNEASAVFIAWLEKHERNDGFYLSAITVHEIEKGINLLRSRGARARAELFEAWLAGLANAYGDRILPFDTTVARCSGELEAMAMSAGINSGAMDAMIAGTAKAHGLTVLTRNLKDFQAFGVAVVSPNTVVGSNEA